jgi:Aminotransferase class I and II
MLCGAFPMSCHAHCILTFALQVPDSNNRSCSLRTEHSIQAIALTIVLECDVLAYCDATLCFATDPSTATLPQPLSASFSWPVSCFIPCVYPSMSGMASRQRHASAVQVDIINSTLGKALGGATGGYTTGRSDVVSLLRQRSRPYLFSNTLAPSVAAASLAVFRMLEGGSDLLTSLKRNTAHFRKDMLAAGFKLGGVDHPIVVCFFLTQCCSSLRRMPVVLHAVQLLIACSATQSVTNEVVLCSL